MCKLRAFAKSTWWHTVTTVAFDWLFKRALSCPCRVLVFKTPSGDLTFNPIKKPTWRRHLQSACGQFEVFPNTEFTSPMVTTKAWEAFSYRLVTKPKRQQTCNNQEAASSLMKVDETWSNISKTVKEQRGSLNILHWQEQWSRLACPG